MLRRRLGHILSTRLISYTYRPSDGASIIYGDGIGPFVAGAVEQVESLKVYAKMEEKVTVGKIEGKESFGAGKQLPTGSNPHMLLYVRSFSSFCDGSACDYPLDPIPNRPLRRQSRPPTNQKFSKFDHGRAKENLNSLRSTSDDNFLERFKIGFDGKSEDRKLESANSVTKSSENEEVETISSPKDADEIFKKMKETGLIPSAVAMLDGLCKDGLVQEAMKLFGLMREKGSIPEVVVYTAVVDGFCKAHKFDDAVRIFKKMQANGILPNAFSYGVLIGGLFKGKRMEDGYRFCIEMLEAGHLPNLATFTGLVDGYCQEKGLEKTRSAISSMKEKGYFVEEKAVREYLEKKGPFSPLVWQAILGENALKRSLF